jgi:hypothetical protein
MLPTARVPCDDQAMSAPAVLAPPRAVRVLLAILLLSLECLAWAQGAIPYSLPPEPSATAPSLALRGAPFDATAAQRARLQQQPTYIESIVIEGYDPDARRVPKKTPERRFGDALNAPAAAGMLGSRTVDSTPCMSLASTWNNIGSSFVPTSGCP